MSGLTVFGRLWRDRLASLSALVLMLVVLASSLLSLRADQQLGQVLDRNWRGAYDILVRPADLADDAADTGGFVEGNFVAVSGRGGLSVSDLQRIRGLTGVEVAAPIGLVGQVGYPSVSAMVNIPDVPGGQTVLGSSPGLYKFSYRLNLTDAGGTRTVDQQTVNVALRRQSQNVSESTMTSDGAGNISAAPDQGQLFGGPSLPPFSASVIAVDPVAERELLGPNGAFLDPLVSVPSGDRTAAALASNVPYIQQLPKQFFVSTAALTSAGQQGSTAPVVPMLVNNAPSSKLTLTLSVDKANEPVRTWPEFAGNVRDLAAKAHFTTVGKSSKDLSSLLTPFAPQSLGFAWPGTENAGDEAAYTADPPTVIPTLVGRPAYEVTAGPSSDGATPAFRVVPRGVVSIAGQPWSAGASVSGVQSYRTPVSTDAQQDETPLSMPVATFSVAGKDLGTAGAGYVPLGAYDPASTSVLAATGGRPPSGTAVEANPSGLDFISPVPGAITDLQGAQALRGATPIDAIRVRVAGITSYTPEAVAKVSELARQIAGMGFTVTLVAGSSPQPVNIYVPDYRVDAAGKTQDLGWVRQDWTTTGAAVTVQGALSGLTLLLLTAALAVGVLLFLATAIAARPQRAASATVLRTLGWERRRIMAWHAGPAVLLLAVLGVAAGALLAISRASTPTVWAAGTAIAAAAAGVVVSARVSPTRASRPSSASASLPTTPARVALRQIRQAPGSLLISVLSITVVVVGIAATTVAILNARQHAGATRLAGIAIDGTAVATICLASLLVVSGLALSALARRIDAGSRNETRTAFSLAGWPRRDRRQLQLTHSMVAAGLAGALVIVCTAGLIAASGHGLAVVFAAAAGWITSVTILGALDLRRNS